MAALTGAEVAALTGELEATRELAIVVAYRHGATWEEIGTALGVSAQAAHRKYGPRVRGAESAPKPSN